MAIMDSPISSRQIPLDPEISFHSVARLAKPGTSFDGSDHRRHKHQKIPLPAPFKRNKSRALRKLRNAQVWRSGTRDQQVEQMAQWFPNLPLGGSHQGLSNPFLARYGDVGFQGGSSSSGGGGVGNDGRSDDRSDGISDGISDSGSEGSSKGGSEGSRPPLSPYGQRAANYSLNYKKQQVTAGQNTPAVPYAQQIGTCPQSEMGALAKLPGELRNKVYRLAVLEEKVSDSVLVSLKPNTCAVGPCLHTKVAEIMPGIINTCRQARWECAAIYFAENAGFTFDEGTVLQSCVGNYIRSIGMYVKLVRKMTFKMLRPITINTQFLEWCTYHLTMVMPEYSTSGLFEITHLVCHTVPFRSLKTEICICPLMCFTQKLNDRQEELLDYDPFNANNILKHSLPPVARTSPGVPVGEFMAEFVDSEEVSDFVWRLRTTKQGFSQTRKCKECKLPVFTY